MFETLQAVNFVLAEPQFREWIESFEGIANTANPIGAQVEFLQLMELGQAGDGFEFVIGQVCVWK